MNPNPEQNTEDGILASQIKTTGQAYYLSENKARQIISQLKAPVLSPLSSHLKRREQGRSIISSFTSHINIFMSTTAKSGLVALVLVLVGVFSYTQLGTRPSSDIAMNESASEEVSSGDAATSMMMAADAPVGSATGNVDDAVSAILASSASESLVLGEEDADAALINNDSQELSDFNQSINDNDF